MKFEQLPSLRNVLSSVFSVQTGLSDESAKAMFLRAVSADPILMKEIVGAFDSEATDWKELLFNDEYEVYEAETSDEARELARELLLDPLENH